MSFVPTFTYSNSADFVLNAVHRSSYAAAAQQRNRSDFYVRYSEILVLTLHAFTPDFPTTAKGFGTAKS